MYLLIITAVILFLLIINFSVHENYSRVHSFIIPLLTIQAQTEQRSTFVQDMKQHLRLN
jgi:uncharacterized membrane protein